MSMQPPPIGTPMFTDINKGILSPTWYLWFVNNTVAVVVDTTDTAITQSSMEYDAQSAITLLKQSVQGVLSQIHMQHNYQSEIDVLRKALQSIEMQTMTQCDYRAEIAGLKRELNDIRTQFSMGV